MTAKLAFGAKARVPWAPHVDVEPVGTRLPGRARDASADRSVVSPYGLRSTSLDAWLTFAAMMGFAAAIAASFGAELAGLDEGVAPPAVATIAHAAGSCAPSDASL